MFSFPLRTALTIFQKALAAFSKIYVEPKRRPDLHSAASFTPSQRFAWLPVSAIGIFPFLKGPRGKFSLSQCRFHVGGPAESLRSTFSPVFAASVRVSAESHGTAFLKKTKCKKISGQKEK